MGTILYDIVVQPLVFVIDLAFSLAYRLLANPGLAIVVVSLVVNAICTPLYAMADARQEEERARQKKMERWVSHIKRTFSGDERFMMLNAYYEEQGYKQWYALGSSVSLLLQIPIFMAAYSYLSGLEVLRGASFLMIDDLGAPDALLAVGGATINLLPIAMTVLNVVSSAIYTRGLPLKDKAQPFVLAGLFLVLLYNSPSGLVFYWTCNQVFSLVRNVVTKVARPSARTVAIASQTCLVAAVVALVAQGVVRTPKRAIALVALVVLVELVLLRSRHADREASADRADPAADPAAASSAPTTPTREFVLAALLLAALVGLLVPTALMVSSPVEFVAACSPATPLSYVVHVLCVAVGFFLLWGGVFFWLAPDRTRAGIARAWWMLAGVCLADYFVELKSLGVINTSLVFDERPLYSGAEQLISVVIVVAVGVGMWLVWQRARKVVAPVLTILLVTLVGMSVPRIVSIKASTDEARRAAEAGAKTENRASGRLFDENGDPLPIIKLSRTNKNVMVLFLDRGLSCYVPYMLNERPELAEQFDGFTYYPNTISFGEYTVMGSPAVYGGYDYTIPAMNARDDELLVDKHREALLLMPRLFSQAGYTTTMIDGPDVDYHYVGTSFPAMETVEGATYYHAAGAYNEHSLGTHSSQSKARFGRNIVYYSLFSVAPAFVRSGIYNRGRYLEPRARAGYPTTFLNHYSTMQMLPTITTVDEESAGNLILFDTEETHEPTLLKLPDYTLESTTDEEVAEDYGRFTLDGVTIRMDSETRLSHYHVNMAAFLMLGDWFDRLRELGVYDNTRIIIVSDHGRGLGQLDSLLVEGLIDGETYDAEWVNPVFLVKDFDAHGFTTSDEFMTNADTPSLALAGIVDDPVNPDTGNPVSMDAKGAQDQIINTSRNWNLQNQRGTVFDTSDGVWVSVHDNIFDANNWSYIGEELQ